MKAQEAALPASSACTEYILFDPLWRVFAQAADGLSARQGAVQDNQARSQTGGLLSSARKWVCGSFPDGERLALLCFDLKTRAAFAQPCRNCPQRTRRITSRSRPAQGGEERQAALITACHPAPNSTSRAIAKVASAPTAACQVTHWSGASIGVASTTFCDFARRASSPSSIALNRRRRLGVLQPGNVGKMPRQRQPLDRLRRRSANVRKSFTASSFAFARPLRTASTRSSQHPTSRSASSADRPEQSRRFGHDGRSSIVLTKLAGSTSSSFRGVADDMPFKCSRHSACQRTA